MRQMTDTDILKLWCGTYKDPSFVQSRTLLYLIHINLHEQLCIYILNLTTHMSPSQ